MEPIGKHMQFFERHYLIDATFNFCFGFFSLYLFSRILLFLLFLFVFLNFQWFFILVKQVVPYGCFEQIPIIHVAKFDTVHPFIYVLISSRTQLACTHVFRYMNENIFSLNCASFTSDYEVAMRNALRSCFPDSKLVSCWFDYCQAICRRASQLPAFFQLISTNSAARKLYFKFQALALLECSSIIDAFNKLKNLTHEYGPFEPFVKYFEHQWIKRVSRSS